MTKDQLFTPLIREEFQFLAGLSLGFKLVSEDLSCPALNTVFDSLHFHIVEERNLIRLSSKFSVSIPESKSFELERLIMLSKLLQPEKEEEQ